MRYGFIGCGNMGGAVARAVCRGVGPENVVLANRTPAKAEALAEALGCRAATNDVVAQDCDVIFLGVKPQMMADMLAGIRRPPRRGPLRPSSRRARQCARRAALGRHRGPS